MYPARLTINALFNAMSGMGSAVSVGRTTGVVDATNSRVTDDGIDVVDDNTTLVDGNAATMDDNTATVDDNTAVVEGSMAVMEVLDGSATTRTVGEGSTSSANLIK